MALPYESSRLVPILNPTRFVIAFDGAATPYVIFGFTAVFGYAGSEYVGAVIV